DFLRRNLLRMPIAGRRLHLVSVELIVRRAENGRIITVGIELDPVAGRWRRLFDLTKVWLESRLGRR
ncbi:MAG TPA: hypothetical protein DC046_16290, partial [Rhodospirillaceae bacterium]|nr:hypothetical protein [Rhodospirillaceae bacterium]